MSGRTAAGGERLERIARTLGDERLDALICTLPENVLLLSGYWPVVGTALAVATPGGRVAVLAPEDERDLAHGGWATEVRTYTPGSLESLAGPEDTVREPLTALLADLGVASGRLGWEDGAFYQGASYAAMYLFGSGVPALLSGTAPRGTLVPGMPAISRLRSSLTPYEVDRVRLGCAIAGEAFVAATGTIRPGRSEAEVAVAIAGPLEVRGLNHPAVRRTRAFAWCMSGPHSALAGAAYARTRDRRLQEGDLVLVHCNTYIDGYWTDITRTYCLGQPDERQQAMYDAIADARDAALAEIAPDARAADVDAAARRVLAGRGFGDYFTHGIGHSVGFSVISADFPPRLHPASPDRLAVGMTFNIEPAIYIQGYGGIRHCDVVTVHEDGPEVLTGFQSGLEELAIAV
ncbi:MAG TPA: Xaa-Pro peptidase family protein [Chloroflexota bacterium]|nr:Xaa-Pro peptidase family protein [Chloroflexota bacterium]